MRQHHDRFEARGRGILEPELAANRRFDPEQRKQIRRHRAAADPLGAEPSPLNTKFRSQVTTDALNRRRVAEIEQIFIRDFRVAPARFVDIEAMGEWMVDSRSVRSPNGIGRSSMPFTSVKMATLTPMPTAIVRSAPTKKPASA